MPRLVANFAKTINMATFRDSEKLKVLEIIY